MNHVQESYSKTVFGFWLYLLSDFVLFATFFATYLVLRDSTFGGPSAKDLLPLWYTFVQTLLLLSCSLTSGIADVMSHRKNKSGTLIFWGLTFLLGLIFTWMMFSGFASLIQEGNGWQKSGFLSSYFTLVGTHAFHMVFALLWIFVLLPPIFLYGVTDRDIRRLTCLRMFWQFLGIIWVTLYAMIYLVGVG
jgi:cytochrome o ubiquinol oxidase subunit III